MAKGKSFRPKARSPRGFRDRSSSEIAAERSVLAAITSVYDLYGFDQLETPSFEYTDALGKFLPDTDRPNAGVFSLQDDDEQWMSLRYDLTAPLARFVAENYDPLPKPFKRFQVGSVWRNEKPGPGRFREFTQCDADIVGAPGPAADAEMCAMFGDALEAAGVAPDEYVIRINNRKVLTGVLEAAGLAGDEQAGTRLTVLRALDKFDKFGAEGVRLLLGAGRKDESGDFTEGAGLSGDQADVVMALIEAPSDDGAAAIRALRDVVGGTAIGADGVDELEAIAESLAAQGYDLQQRRIDPSVVRGLEYYTGPVYEAELLFDIEDEKGNPVRVGYIGGGGRYDDLVKRFKGVEVPATGISVGVSRLVTALQLKGRIANRSAGPVVVLALDGDDMRRAQGMAQELRRAGVRAEAYLGGSGMRAQLKYADRRNASIAVIEGEDERARGEVTLKDLILGAELSGEIEDNKAWREDQPAQVSVERAGVVEAVKAMLSRRSS